VVCYFYLLTEHARGIPPFPLYHVVFGRNSIVFQLPGEYLNFERDFRLSNVLKVVTTIIFC
jgi:hypothetical protein